MLKNKNINLIEIKRNLTYILAHDNEKYYILNEYKSKEIKHLRLGKIEYNSHFIDDNNNQFELITMHESLNQEIAFHFFDVISKNNNSLPQTLEIINKIFASYSHNMPLWKKRGIFAELYAIKTKNVFPNNIPNAIYDMKDLNTMNDCEIKSYSKTKKEVSFTYQQLTNNNNAFALLFEVIESSNGLNLFDLYTSINKNIQDRYYWIEFLKNDDDKFIIDDNNTIKINMCDINNNLRLPNFCKNAIYTYDIDNIRNWKNKII